MRLDFQSRLRTSKPPDINNVRWLDSSSSIGMAHGIIHSVYSMTLFIIVMFIMIFIVMLSMHDVYSV
jgi:hypothetical protein